MKKIFFLITLVTVSITCFAQKVTLLKDGQVVETYYASEVDNVVFEEDHEYVNLGLSVKWATCNIGAENCYDYGDYFAWGEIKGINNGKVHFSWGYYKYAFGSGADLYKYCTSSSYGTVDNKKRLEAADDAATVNWGPSWRMPTGDEVDELRNKNNCSWTWYNEGNMEFNGVAGYKVQSKRAGYTDKYIFLPAAGRWESTTLYYAGSDGYYWSSSLLENTPCYALTLDFDDTSRDQFWRYRCYGLSVRPVKK